MDDYAYRVLRTPSCLPASHPLLRNFCPMATLQVSACAGLRPPKACFSQSRMEENSRNEGSPIAPELVAFWTYTSSLIAISRKILICALYCYCSSLPVSCFSCTALRLLDGYMNWTSTQHPEWENQSREFASRQKPVPFRLDHVGSAAEEEFCDNLCAERNYRQEKCGSSVMFTPVPD